MQLRSREVRPVYMRREPSGLTYPLCLLACRPTSSKHLPQFELRIIAEAVRGGPRIVFQQQARGGCYGRRICYGKSESMSSGGGE